MDNNERTSMVVLLEVLERELARVWIGWIHQVISGGRVGVNLNGELGNFFKTHKG
jgi:hypothetical protein